MPDAIRAAVADAFAGRRSPVVDGILSARPSGYRARSALIVSFPEKVPTKLKDAVQGA